MKMIKVDEDVHAELKKSDKSINQTVRDLVFGKSRTDLDVVLDQLRLIHERLDGMKSQNNFLGNSEESPQATEEESLESKRVRLRLEEIAMKKSQNHAVNHEEDCDQSENWI